MNRGFGALAMRTVALLALAAMPAAAEKVKTEKVEGYAEYRQGDTLIVDGQRVTVSTATKNKGKEHTFETVPLGWEVRVKGVRQEDGSLEALEFEAKPNGAAMFEGEALSATGELEEAFLRLGRLPRELGGAKLRTSGREVERVRRITERLLPPYKTMDDFRVYVSGDWEWNAFACANGMIVVNAGLLEDMDDDEVALILGHEIAHATHEHTRRSMKKGLWTALIAAGVTGAAEAIEDEELRVLAQGAAQLGALAWNNGFGRSMEDQADRVGMRYAYEAGYDVSKAPRLWRKFAQKYGDADKVTNFFFGDHSLSLQRATHAERQVALNFPDARERAQSLRAPQRTADARPAEREQPERERPAPVRVAKKKPAPVRTIGGEAAVYAKGDALTEEEPEPDESEMDWVEGLVASKGALEDDGTMAKSIDGTLPVKVGMTEEEVLKTLGKPNVAIEGTWIYSKITVVFDGGKVKEVQG